MSFGSSVIQTCLSCVKFRHSIPFILAQLESLNYLCLFNLLTGTLLPALLKHEVAKELLYKQIPEGLSLLQGAAGSLRAGLQACLRLPLPRSAPSVLRYRRAGAAQAVHRHDAKA